MGLASLAPVLPIVGQVTEDRIRELYGLPLEQFTAERNALAAELRSAEVKALRKPSAAAWAVNQLVRAEPELVEALLGAGGELRQAHRQAASGKGAEQLRAAGGAERAAVEALMARAAEVLGRAPSAALGEAMRNTLHAASSDDEARELVASGTLVEGLRPVGLGPVPASIAGRSARAASGAKPRRNDSAEEDGAAERERAAEQARAVRSAHASVAAFQREVDAAARALERAEEAYARARDAAEAAGERLKDVRKRHREAKAGLREAQRKSEK